MWRAVLLAWRRQTRSHCGVLTILELSLEDDGSKLSERERSEARLDGVKSGICTLRRAASRAWRRERGGHRGTLSVVPSVQMGGVICTM